MTPSEALPTPSEALPAPFEALPTPVALPTPEDLPAPSEDLPAPSEDRFFHEVLIATYCHSHNLVSTSAKIPETIMHGIMQIFSADFIA